MGERRKKYALKGRIARKVGVQKGSISGRPGPIYADCIWADVFVGSLCSFKRSEKQCAMSALI